MKRNELAEVKKLDIKTIEQRVAKSRAEILDARLNLSDNSSTNYKKVKNERRVLAQLLTVLNLKQKVEKLEDQNG